MPDELKSGRYRIEREIGRGGMGQVYRAHDTRLGRTVALKMIPPELTHDSELRRRLALEARAASALNHPGIATVYDFEEHAAESFIVFEYVDGATLRERLKQRRPTIEEILDAGIQLADALAAAHDRGVTHRDLKPENIMLVSSSGRLARMKILDFGLAKLRPPVEFAAGDDETETATVMTARGQIVGTVNYMAPEQVEGEPADARSDLYSAGLVLYEMATGVNPFCGKTPPSTIANILKRDAPPALELNPALPAELDRILRKCLRKRPEERYQSARDLRVDLANLQTDSATSVPSVAVPDAEPAMGSGVIPRGVARGLLLAIQAGYLAMYGGLFYDLSLPTHSLPPPVLLSERQMEILGLLHLLVAVAGTPIRLYLLSALAADYPDLGRKYRFLFPLVLVLDGVWSLAPAFLVHKIGAFAIPAIAALLYLPFAQRRLLYDAYSPRGGRSSGLRTTPPV